MRKNTIIVVLVLLIGLATGYQAGKNKSFSFGSAHMMPDGSMMSRNIDQHFIVQMIPHHEGAIEMAKIALTKSKRPEILSLANDIIEAQEAEIKDMRSWHELWFGSTPLESGMGMMHMGGMEGDLNALQVASVTEFDREFMLQMIPHHEMAIMMAQMLLAATERNEMERLADNIITSQAREIQMMRSWLDTWY